MLSGVARASLLRIRFNGDCGAAVAKATHGPMSKRPLIASAKGRLGDKYKRSGRSTDLLDMHRQR